MIDDICTKLCTLRKIGSIPDNDTSCLVFNEAEHKEPNLKLIQEHLNIIIKCLQDEVMTNSKGERINRQGNYKLSKDYLENNAGIRLPDKFVDMASEKSQFKAALEKLKNELSSSDSILKSLAAEMLKEFKKIDVTKISENDLPKITKLVNTTTACMSEVNHKTRKAYCTALNEVEEKISIGTTPWVKSRIGLICAGFGLIALGIGLMFVPGAFPGAVALIGLGVMYLIGAGMLPGKKSTFLLFDNAARNFKKDVDVEVSRTHTPRV